MELSTFQDLLSPSGQAALQAAQELQPREVDFLRHFTSLSRRYPADLARAALESAILQQEAVSKFPFAGRLYFTRPALEQASGYEVSTYRVGRFRGFKRLVDLGCSVGGDTLALASLAPTLGIDLDPLRLAMARANLKALGLEGRTAWIRADLSAALPLSPIPDLALFFDPARRSNGKRAFSVHAYQPPLAVVDRWLSSFPALGVKLSPGVRLNELRDYEAELEFVSLRGELKEALLWFGPLASVRRRATVLPGPFTFTPPPELADREVPGAGSGDVHQQLLPLNEPRAYLYEPDPSILRAGLVQALGVQLEAAQMDPDIAYLTADCLTETPFARAWAVDDWFPFGVKRLRAVLRQRGVGRVVVKKRGSPLEPEALIKALRLKGSQDVARVIFLTHLRGNPIVVICMPESDTAATSAIIRATY